MLNSFLLCLFIPLKNESFHFPFLLLSSVCVEYIYCMYICLCVCVCVRAWSSPRAQSWLNSIFQLHGQANQPWTWEPLFPEDGRGQSPRRRRCIGITSLIGEKKYAFPVCVCWMYTYILAQEGDCECVYVCVHSYPMSTKMTSVLNVQSLKLKLLPTLPLSVSLCWDIRLPLAPDS